MFFINTETFKLTLKSCTMTQRSLAEKANVGEKTIGRIKKGIGIRQNTLDSIAKVLRCDKEDLLNPPDEAKIKAGSTKKGMHRLVADLDKDTIDNLTLASHRYKISILEILAYAPLLFSVVAEISLEKRKQALKEWTDKMIAEIETCPVHKEDGDINSLRYSVYEAVEAETESIERRELEGLNPSDYFTPYGYAVEEGEQKNAFLETICDLADTKGEDDLIFFGSRIGSITYDYSPLLYASWDIIPFEEETNYNNLARETDLPYRNIPKELLTPDKTQERVAFLASFYGGAEGDLDLAIKIWNRHHKITEEKEQSDA